MLLDIGVVAFPSGYRARGISRSNRFLALRVVEARYRVMNCGSRAVIISGSEVTKALTEEWDMSVARSVQPRTGRARLDVNKLWEEAKVELVRQDVNEVMIVAQPSWQLLKLSAMAVKDGYTIFR
ncbi:MAG TPA: hypothetical protein VIM31_00600 [Candidatus Microsaccharimonas sp.]|jgi:hypothetical protein